jgi:acetyl-CoA C-acetyltransferase
MDTAMIDPRTPVLVGVGVVQQKEKDPARAEEAVALMTRAARLAGEDSGVPALLAALERIAVPQGLWSYSDAARMVARAIGAEQARTTCAQVGILQQSLMSAACSRIAAGESRVEMVLGGEARFRQLQAQIAGQQAPETAFTEAPDELLKPDAELVLDAEVSGGLGYERFSEIAVQNPDAWKRERVPAEQIRNASAKNRMLAFPYTKLHNTSWNVDQAAALLFCSAGLASEMGVPRERWVFPRAGTESNHMLALSQRPELHRCPGAQLAGRRALALAGISVDELDLLEMYSCFPIAVESYATEIGIPLDRDLSVTGGMPFAGGPLNNYVLQATARMARLLRERGQGAGLVTSVSGYLTKQGFGVWSMAPGEGFGFADVTEEVAALAPARRVSELVDGPVTIRGCTVMYHEDRALCAVAVVDQADGSRSVASSQDPAVMAMFESSECCGNSARVEGGQLRSG